MKIMTERKTDHANNETDDLIAKLKFRFGEDGVDWNAITSQFKTVTADQADIQLQSRLSLLQHLADHRSCRSFKPDPVPLALIEAVAALAFCAPAKSDLQQRDLIVVENPDTLAQLKAHLAHQPWTSDIPRLLVVCGNNRRQRQIHDLRGHPFVNDHLDAFFNAAVDAGILLHGLITAAGAVGLGCCPISGIRDHAAEVSEILGLPNHVFPVAGLAIGWPASESEISMRLPLDVTVHVDQFDDASVMSRISEYDQRRADAQPYANQKDTGRFGELPQRDYVWSEDKARQYASAERANFGTFVNSKGFKLI